MSLQVWGTEGSVSPDAVVVWGAAALLIEGDVVNSFTGRRVSLDEADRLRSAGHLFKFDEPITLRGVHEPSPLVVALISRSSPWHSLFLVDRDKTVGLAKAAETESWYFYVFEDRQSFDGYALKVADLVLKDILYSPDVKSGEAVVRHRAVVRNALGLVPNHADLNAMRVFLSPTRIVENAARSSLRGDVAVRRFQRTLTALQRSSDDQYELKYERGAATGGGMDVDVAADTLQAVNRASHLLQGSIAKDYPYLRRFPPPRFKEMQAASAHMVFVANTGETELLGDRAARYLALESLAEAVRGDVELDDSEDQRALDATVTKIVRPTPETSLRHKPLAAAALQPVDMPTVDKEIPLRSEQMDFLGVISGLSRDSHAELQLSPSLRISVSTTNNGDGQTPNGAGTIKRDGSFLRRPCLISVVREHTLGGVARYHLRRLRLLEERQPVTVTALPSTAVPGAFLVGRRLRVVLKRNTLEGDMGRIENVGSGSLEDARQMLEQLALASSELELLHAEDARWVRSARPPEPKQLQRVLAVLGTRNGSALVDVIRVLVQRRFGKSLRGNNTRREVVRHPELLEFDDDNRRLVRWTDRGRRLYLAYVGAGGVLQQGES